MPMNDHDRSILLRAEIRSERETVVSYARELTTSSVVVVTDWRPPLGTEVVLCISFPTVVEPIEIRARVTAHRSAQGVGSPAGVAFTFDVDSAASGHALRQLVEMVERRLTDAPASTPRDYRVLLVEDNDFIRDMFAYGIAKFFAQRSGHVMFDHAGDAESAWDKLARSPYDLVIVDYYLPTEDGAAFIARLRGEPRFARSPIVAISVGGREAREATMTAGADLFLDKPVVLRDLFRTLQVLSQRGALA